MVKRTSQNSKNRKILIQSTLKIPSKKQGIGIIQTSLKKKCVLMFSGGLDSRLALKIMQEQKFEITALFFKLPFGTGCCNEGCCFNFSQLQGIQLKIFDCTKGKLLQEYLEVIKKAEHGRGAGINPCIDCRIFMFKKAKEFADKNKIDLVVSGEVLGERPMSQMKKSMKIIEEKSRLSGRLLRPLSAKLLPETDAEKNGLIDRIKLLDVQGRRRDKQIDLAKKFKISYPTPAGGCYLCEKEVEKKLKYLLERGLNDKEIHLVNIGRHFLINNCWVVLSRNEKEGKLIESIGTQGCAPKDFRRKSLLGAKKEGGLIIPDYIGPTAIILDKYEKKTTEKIKELIKAYSKQGSLEERKKFDELRL